MQKHHGSDYQFKKYPIYELKLKTPKNCAQNLGITFDKNMSPNEHKNQMSKKSYFQLRIIRQLRKYIWRDYNHNDQFIYTFKVEL